MGRLAFQVQPQTLPAVSDVEVTLDPAVASLLPEPLLPQLREKAAAVLTAGVAHGASTLQIVCEVRVHRQSELLSRPWYDGPRRAWKLSTLTTTRHVNQKAVGSSRNVLLKANLYQRLHVLSKRHMAFHV
jgi:hypothetical protein